MNSDGLLELRLKCTGKFILVSLPLNVSGALWEWISVHFFEIYALPLLWKKNLFGWIAVNWSSAQRCSFLVGILSLIVERTIFGEVIILRGRENRDPWNHETKYESITISRPWFFSFDVIRTENYRFLPANCLLKWHYSRAHVTRCWLIWSHLESKEAHQYIRLNRANHII